MSTEDVQICDIDMYVRFMLDVYYVLSLAYFEYLRMRSP